MGCGASSVPERDGAAGREHYDRQEFRTSRLRDAHARPPSCAVTRRKVAGARDCDQNATGIAVIRGPIDRSRSVSKGPAGTTSYTAAMTRERTVKITVSIPASLFDGADRLARRRGVPRSRLYAEALQQYVDEDSESEVTRQLDEVAAEIDTSLDAVVKELQRRVLTRPGG